jgi:hypothetical protein
LERLAGCQSSTDAAAVAGSLLLASSIVWVALQVAEDVVELAVAKRLTAAAVENAADQLSSVGRVSQPPATDCYLVFHHVFGLFCSV